MITKNTILGGLYGALVGDALGVPYEFQPAVQIPCESNIEMDPSNIAGFKRTYPSIKPGTWSDDGSLLLCLLSASLNATSYDESWCQSFARNMIQWRTNGLYAVDGKKFDIGEHTALALTEWQEAFDNNQLPYSRVDYAHQNGNGSLMRVMGIVLPTIADDSVARVFSLACLQSAVTHSHDVSKLCCGLYAVIAWYIVNEQQLPIADVIDKAFAYVATLNVNKSWLNVIRKFEDDNQCTGSGYVVDSFWTSLKCIWSTGNYEDAVKMAISYGLDTDTTACITGGLAGLIYGYDGIPSRWLEALRGKIIVQPIIEQLLSSLNVVD